MKTVDVFLTDHWPLSESREHPPTPPQSLFSPLTCERSPVGLSAMRKNFDNPFICARRVNFKELADSPTRCGPRLHRRRYASSLFFFFPVIFLLIFNFFFFCSNLKHPSVMNENEIMASASRALLKLPVSLPFLPRTPRGPHGAPAIPTWGEQYPKIILVCFPKALVNRWFLKSPGFLPA